METIRLGKTNLIVTKNGFGALPVQRVDVDGAVKILRKAYEGGINYFDTARMYTDSEKKIEKKQKYLLTKKNKAVNICKLSARAARHR